MTVLTLILYISTVQLRRILHRMCVNSRRRDAPHHMIVNAVRVRPILHVVLHSIMLVKSWVQCMYLQEELSSSASLKGFRSMCHVENSQHALNIAWRHEDNFVYKMVVCQNCRDSLLVLLRNVDPLGTAARKAQRLYVRRRIYRTKASGNVGTCMGNLILVVNDITHYIQGPHYICHVDGYGKLKPFGTAIHGCIDGNIWDNSA